ncbi:hypothetical protein AB0395_14645 [Streptosporangium sp. NPDC051023]|uniref:hypothetical protein n=1 Tax=Streptosporangium sp. NPDC051023 TaxID=3155410 RepID=UPI00344D4BE5
MAAPPLREDVVVDRVRQEAQCEFPDWRFSSSGGNWTAQRGKVRRSAKSLAELLAVLRVVTPDVPGWNVFWSDEHHLYASRDCRFTVQQEKAGCWRTVDADTPEALTDLIAKQEERAGRAWA